MFSVFFSVVPSAPGRVVATRNTKTSVVVQWDKPKHEEDLYGYYIDYSVVGSNHWEPSNHKPIKYNRYWQYFCILGRSENCEDSFKPIYMLSNDVIIEVECWMNLTKNSLHTLRAKLLRLQGRLSLAALLFFFFLQREESFVYAMTLSSKSRF